MNRKLKLTLALMISMLGLLRGSGDINAQVNTLIWSQWSGGGSIVGLSMQTRSTATAINREVADDFDIGGTIERVVLGGYRDMTAPSNPVVYGAYVQFYAWVSGAPAVIAAATEGETFKKARKP